jgi:hypothetical protein
MTSQRFALAVLACALALAGCSTPDSRIQKNTSAFAGYPPAVQAKIRAGEIEVGYTPAMVALALGRADRVYRRQTAAGETEVWAYADKTPSIGFGIGIGGGGHHSSGGVALGTSTGGDRLHVVFNQGKVTAIDRFER